MSLTFLVAPAARGLFAIDKPPGTIVIPGRGEDEGPSLREQLIATLGREVWPVHRIDRDTSGVLVFALDADSHRAASMAFEHGEVHKRYVALVQGRVTAPLDIELPLAPARKRKMRVAIPGEEGKDARTLVRPRQVFAKASLVEAEPLTGRQHQIRVHLRAKGHPLLFDHQYGRRTPLTARELGGDSDELVLSRTPLHAESLEIPALGFSVVAPLPDDLRRCVELLARALPAVG